MFVILFCFCLFFCFVLFVFFTENGGKDVANSLQYDVVLKSFILFFRLVTLIENWLINIDRGHMWKQSVNVCFPEFPSYVSVT